MSVRRLAVALVVLAGCHVPPPAAPSPLDALVSKILGEDRIPGAVLVAGNAREVTYRRAFGTARLDTLFDLASCTKVVATTTCAMQLVEEGRIGLDDPVQKHLPFVKGREITLRQLLVHRSGFPAYHRPKARGADAILDEFLSLKTVEGTKYS